MFRWGYYNEPAGRAQLDRLIRATFGFSFAAWNELGLEFEEYTPFTVFDGDRAVANVSASPMHLTVAGEEHVAVQIGTVATLPEYRRQGHIRSLMERAHAHWAPRCDLFFLFANETVLDFYPQFGYRPVATHTFTAKAPRFQAPAVAARKLDLKGSADLELLRQLADERAPLSMRLGVRRHAWLLLFHAAVVFPQQLHYIESLDVVVISELEEDRLLLVDVIGRQVPTLEQIYPFVGAAHVQDVDFGFAPDLLEIEQVTASVCHDANLFVRGDFAAGDSPFRFPTTSEA